LATGPDDRIYVVGDHAVQILAANGSPESVIPLKAEATCVAVGGADHVEPGRIYVGAGGNVEVIDAGGQKAAVWQVPGDSPVLTSLAVAARDIFAADASSRMVWRFTTEGQLASRIGKPDPDRQVPGFIVNGPYFDVATGADGLIHVANPGKLRISTYTYNGDLGTSWGRASSALDGFFGCCNPVHFAVLPDGRFVTSEKGIPRIKIYGPQGDFQCVVAGPEQLASRNRQVTGFQAEQSQRVFDVAVDRQGRILVLDPPSRTVRIFVEVHTLRAKHDA
jgi:hypothetical protein